jgi:glycosyltransferase involved in cell wall biosynthesis
VHLVPDLALGGAETALVRLVEGLDRTRFASLVVTLRDGGSLVARAEAAGARVASLGMRTRLPSPVTLARLRAVLRGFAPDVLQGWMYHGNLAAWVGARLLPERPAVAWNVRQSLASDGHRRERATTRLAIRANVALSGQVERIVFNAHSSAAQHTALGFDASRSEVVPNGFDAARFRPDPTARATLRAALGLPGDALLAGMVARVHPVKRHDLFLAAVAAAAQGGLDVHAVLAGSGASPASAEIARLLASSGAAGRVHLLGERADVERILPGLDVLVSASGWAEGFPNVVGEAMACGVACLVTDTGDCASIVGDAGVVVPPGDGAALASALAALLRRPAEERARMGARGRARILASFTLERCVARYAELYASLAGVAGEAAAGRTPAA